MDRAMLDIAAPHPEGVRNQVVGALNYRTYPRAFMRIASAQFSAAPDYRRNLAIIEGLMRRAASEGAELVVLPEMSLAAPPSSPKEFRQLAQPLDGAFISGVANLCREYGLCVVVGTIESNPSGLPYNTAVVLGPDGLIAGTYRKVHLYDAFGYRESDGIAQGNLTPPFIFTKGPFKLGIITCYDLRFPESARRLVDAGANVILVPALWVAGTGKKDQWITLIRARAIENTSYVVAANQHGPSGIGNSMIVGPSGVVLASDTESTDLLTVALDEGHLEEIRQRNPSLANRRLFIASTQGAL